ncbi:MAG: hypothetical protein ACE5JP_03240 [Candidatus Bipolaricaulia bacterium]
MTPAQARRKLRSLLYRSRLAEEILEIKAKLIVFLEVDTLDYAKEVKGGQ